MSRRRVDLVCGVLGVFLLLVAVFSVVLDVRMVKGNSGTIYIRANGAIEPPSAPISTGDKVTYTITNNVNDSIEIERDNIILDGAGYTIQGAGSWAGIDLEGRSNVTIRNVVIKGFVYGIDIDNSSNLSIHGNNITYNLKDGIFLYRSSHNRIFGNSVIENDEDGMDLISSSYNSIFGNNITENDFDGIGISDSSNYNDIFRNNIAKNDEDGVDFYASNYNRVYENNITNSWMDGIDLDYSSNNSIFGNNITENGDDGIDIRYSSLNRIYGNDITLNDYGIYLYSGASNNAIYHNNFINNTQHYYSLGYANIWDDNYPSGGNYWSGYTGVDVKSGLGQNETGSDGIGDISTFLDNYPLMGKFFEFNVTWQEKTYSINIISNSTVSNFDFGTLVNLETGESWDAICFKVSSPKNATGFCRISIPTDLMNDTYRVLINLEEAQFTLLPYSDNTYNYLYFTYAHPAYIHIIPEFPSFLIISMFMAATLTTFIAHRRKLRFVNVIKQYRKKHSR